jgi:DNA helicase-2/ATP-dependent DNA helicase PcrA
MAMLTEHGDYDRVERVEAVALNATVHDLDIAETHNFIANGLVTHNSIYSFRGADIRNILEFEDDHPDAAVVKLEQNYRSTQTILDAANSVISNNRGRKAKSLWSDLGRGAPVHVRELEDEFAEARFVVGEIERRVDEGESRDEMAVFYRTNAQSRVLEEVLVRYDIGYQVIGGRKFYERKEIRDALAYLTFLVNPSDAIAFQRIAGSPRRGIGDTTQQRIVGHANTIGEQVWEIAARPDLVPGLGGAAVKAVSRFMSVMERLRERAEGGASVGDLLEETLHEVGYIEALQAERTIEAEGRLENLEELVAGARDYDESAESPGVDEYLETISLRADTDELEDEAGIVTLMTLHSAKGLEYPVVFVIGCEDGVFPSSRAIEAGDLEEERRLAYVGLTRAKRELYLTYARTRARHGAREWNAPSRFLGEVPPQLTDAEEQLAAAAATPATWGGTAVERPEPRAPSAAFAIGDDVLHAKFGEGVVTGREPGGIVIVRFPAEGEKKLMEDYAPLKKT